MWNLSAELELWGGVVKDSPANKREQLLHNCCRRFRGNGGRQRIEDTNLMAVMVIAASTLIEESRAEGREKCA